jgi:hypothetical protein
MERYSNSSLECCSTHSPEWTATIQEDSLESATAIAFSSSEMGKKLAFVSNTAMVMLLIFSLSTVMWGTIKLSHSVVQLTQFAVQGTVHSAQ